MPQINILLIYRKKTVLSIEEKEIKERLLWLQLWNIFKSALAKFPLFFVIMECLACEFLTTALLAYESTASEACSLGMSKRNVSAYVEKTAGLKNLRVLFLVSLKFICYIANFFIEAGEDW